MKKYLRDRNTENERRQISDISVMHFVEYIIVMH